MSKRVRVKYVGGEAAGMEVRPWDDPDGGRVIVKPGESFETSEEHAAALCVQGVWKRTGPRRPAKRPRPAKTTAAEAAVLEGLAEAAEETTAPEAGD